jgi:GNAT superfamily N-acetyltransferase
MQWLNCTFLGIANVVNGGFPSYSIRMSDNQINTAGSRIGTVRRAGEADVPALILLNDPLQELHATLNPDDFKARPDREELREHFLALIDAERHLIGVFDGARGPCGYVWFERLERPETPFRNSFRCLYIHHIVVESGAREQGVGSALMSWAYHHARQSGASEIAVEHWASNANAHAFFDRSGFENVRIAMRRQVLESK